MYTYIYIYADDGLYTSSPNTHILEFWGPTLMVGEGVGPTMLLPYQLATPEVSLRSTENSSTLPFRTKLGLNVGSPCRT